MLKKEQMIMNKIYTHTNMYISFKDAISDSVSDILFNKWYKMPNLRILVNKYDIDEFEDHYYEYDYIEEYIQEYFNRRGIVVTIIWLDFTVFEILYTGSILNNDSILECFEQINNKN